MDYDYFLSTYGFPIFGIAALVALICWLPINYIKKPGPPWLAALTFYGLIIALATMLIIGFLLPFGSPI